MEISPINSVAATGHSGTTGGLEALAIAFAKVNHV